MAAPFTDIDLSLNKERHERAWEERHIDVIHDPVHGGGIVIHGLQKGPRPGKR